MGRVVPPPLFRRQRICASSRNLCCLLVARDAARPRGISLASTANTTISGRTGAGHRRCCVKRGCRRPPNAESRPINEAVVDPVQTRPEEARSRGGKRYTPNARKKNAGESHCYTWMTRGSTRAARPERHRNEGGV